MEKPDLPELFPGVAWGPGLGVLCWSNREKMESGTGNQWRCRVGPFVCSVQEWPYGLRVTLHGHGYKDDCESRDDALNWLRSRIIAHRDELIRVTGMSENSWSICLAMPALGRMIGA